MTENKTKPNRQSVAAFIASVEPADRRRDCRALLKLMRDATGAAPKMWGSSVVGFGSYHYKYGSGREGNWFVTGFSPRKQDLTLYLMAGVERYPDLLRRLGKHKTGRSCLYLKGLDGVDITVLKRLVGESVKYVRRNYPAA